MDCFSLLIPILNREVSRYMERSMAFIVKDIQASLLVNDHFLFPALSEGLNKIFYLVIHFIFVVLRDGDGSYITWTGL